MVEDDSTSADRRISHSLSSPPGGAMRLSRSARARTAERLFIKIRVRSCSPSSTGYMEMPAWSALPASPSVQAGRRVVPRAARTRRPGLAHPGRAHLHHHPHGLPDLAEASTSSVACAARVSGAGGWVGGHYGTGTTQGSRAGEQGQRLSRQTADASVGPAPPGWATSWPSRELSVRAVRRSAGSDWCVHRRLSSFTSRGGSDEQVDV
jgi:hypothetical protein